MWRKPISITIDRVVGSIGHAEGVRIAAPDSTDAIAVFLAVLDAVGSDRLRGIDLDTE